MGDNRGNAKRASGWGRPTEPAHLDPERPWASSRRRYEWDDSYENGTAPNDEQLEEELFSEENLVNTGINFSKYNNIKVHVKGADIKPIPTFDAGNLHPMIRENVRLARYTTPTPVQKYSIPIITEGYDLMACAQTGSGKTAAFLVPILSNLFEKAKKLTSSRPSGGRSRGKVEPLVLILAPTRELATQIFDECRRFTYRTMMRPCVVYGGADVRTQRMELSKGCDVLTATPGRLNDFLNRAVISLARVKYLVLDEADRMLDMGFEAEIRKIVQRSDLREDGTRQTLMFSATFPRKIQELARDFLATTHVFLTVGRVGGIPSEITQKVYYVKDEDKRKELVDLLLKQPPSRTLIFVETKRGADSLDDFLYNQNFPTTSIHGDRTQREREDALASFKSGRSPILIATAVAARGLDIKNVMHVINYDMANEIDEYIHRIGRTARVGNPGLATTFYNDRNEATAADLVKILIECKQEVPDFLRDHMTRETGSDDFSENTGNNYGGRDEDFSARRNQDSSTWGNQDSTRNNQNSSTWGNQDSTKNNQNSSAWNNQDAPGWNNQDAPGWNNQDAPGWNNQDAPAWNGQNNPPARNNQDPVWNNQTQPPVQPQYTPPPAQPQYTPPPAQPQYSQAPPPMNASNNYPSPYASQKQDDYHVTHQQPSNYNSSYSNGYAAPAPSNSDGWGTTTTQTNNASSWNPEQPPPWM
ncbi:672_t:CDS:10 [Paraglomus occultum]|uniref:ATP-dependent RNA helicase DED1 n=1 Tax=Paraglomus occultum TaxID=144539 RepID=A0A9N9GBL9_9GLOM|nr:672_t:CDS:10 [Paraglomus occultum]